MTLALKDVSEVQYTLSPYDADIVLRFYQSSQLTIPSDVSANFPLGMQFAVECFAGSVVVVPGQGVFIRGTDRPVVGPLRTGVFCKIGASEWLMSVGEGGKSDGTVPLPPTLKSVTPGGGLLKFTWDAPIDDGGHSITNYVAEYSQDQKTWISWPTKYGPNDRSGSIEGLTKGVTYYIRLVAVNEKGPSDPSNVMSGAPTQPFNNATGGEISYYTEGASKFRLHTFRGSGQLTVLQNAGLPWRILCVGSGGTGAGGGGGVNSVMDGSCAPGVYTCNVGGGSSALSWIQNPTGANFLQATGGGTGAGGCGSYNEGGQPNGARGGATVCGGPNDRGGDAANGPQSSVPGTPTYFGGGGGGVCYNCLDSYPGRGGLGGGGNSSSGREGGARSGTPNTGGGGGGNQGGEPGYGASGVIMFAYEVDPAVTYEDEFVAASDPVSVAHVDPDTLTVTWIESVVKDASVLTNRAGKQLIHVPMSSGNMAWVGCAYDPGTGLFEKWPQIVPLRSKPCGKCGGCSGCLGI